MDVGEFEVHIHDLVESSRERVLGGETVVRHHHGASKLGRQVSGPVAKRMCRQHGKSAAVDPEDRYVRNDLGRDYAQCWSPRRLLR